MRRRGDDKNDTLAHRIRPAPLPDASPLRLDWSDWLPRGRATLLRSFFGMLAGLADTMAIIVSAVAVGMLYHWGAYGDEGPVGNFLELGLFVSLMFVTANTMRDEYALSNFLQAAGHGRRTFHLWNIVFACALVFGFATKTTGEFSRATIVGFYFLGLGCLIATRAGAVRLVRASASVGGIPLKRVFLVGYEADVEGFAARYQPWESGMQVVAAAVLRGRETLEEDLALAAASARMLRPDDVFILAPWSERETIDACIDVFLRVPASIHLGPERVLDRFGEARISRVGSVASLHLVRRPLSSSEVALKRAFDVLVSAAAVALLSPLLALVALAIKLDSPGPVFFLQRRYGFNQEPFRIFKFRSMRTMEDGRHVPQAQVDDPRVTRVGRILRATNIDELPQLFNVLSGEMSLVGPRPHALAHDQMYEQAIAFYARRHNVKPGITGWAQVNGLRGDTSGEGKMRKRVEHDLWYIDNWSPLLDLRILWLTVFSRKAYRNAV
ncbi:MAG: exopolysaccharide biosynthesis polyprenyl glycosylphosphotransferase [Methylobacteriaceae bacterium]|nr:exopolysaccharide biosynthesis polyprenyl glycosylphosphotransferase [Methylobacteriaceae bacterium]